MDERSNGDGDGDAGDRSGDRSADVESIESVARAAALAGGAVLSDRYRNGDAAGEYSEHDVKAEADEAAEARMVPVIREAFPDHEVFSEEAGVFEGSEPYRWIVDPLDGTNDFAAGLPTFASSVAVVEHDSPLVATFHLPATGETYVARRNGGVEYDGDLVAARSELPVEASTVALIVGREVPSRPALAARADEIRDALDANTKRVVDSWAPTVHSGLFARGRIQGIVQFHPDEEERAVTDLLAAEAGASMREEGPLSLATTDDRRLELLWDEISS